MKAIFSLLVWSLISGAVYAQFPPCNICEEDGTVGNLDTVIPKGFANVIVQDMTCAEVQQMGADGVFNVLQCILLGQAGIFDSCGCGVVSTPVTPAPGTTEPPPSVPSIAPVAPVPIASGPTSVPIDLPTNATAVPTVTPATTVAGSVYIRSVTVGNSLFETPATDGFESACSSLFRAELADILSDVSCTVRLYTLTPVGDSGNALDIVTRVVGTPIGDNSNPANLTEILPSVFNANASDFVTLLQTEGSQESQAYYENVTFAEAFNPDGDIPGPSVPVPVAAPVPVPVSTPVPVPVPVDVAPTTIPSANVSAGSDDFNGSGMVYIRLQPVGPEALPDAAEVAFEEACTAFYGDQLEGVLEDAACTLRLYSLVPGLEGESSNATTLNAIDTMTEVSGTPVGNTTLEEFEALLISTMTANSDDFITTLQLSGDEEAQAYYANVTTVLVFDRSDEAAPTAVPPTAAPGPVTPPGGDGDNDDDDGLSGGAIAGIVVAVVGVIIVIILLARNCGNENPQPRPLDTRSPSVIVVDPDDKPKYSAVIVPAGGSVKSIKSQTSGATPRSSSASYRQSNAPIAKVEAEPLSTSVVSVTSERMGVASRSVASRRSLTSEGSVTNVRSMKDLSVVSAASARSVVSAASARSSASTGRRRLEPPEDDNDDDDDSSTEDMGVMM